jgi:hypothetical protein
MDWFAYLRVLCAGLVVFGAALLLLPSLSMAGFGLMVYGDPAFPPASRARPSSTSGSLTR